METNPQLKTIRDPKAIEVFWLKCEAVAAYYIQSAAESPHLAIERVKIAQLHLATEQVALGLIRVYSSYTPNYFGLPFLLGLCGHFSTLAATLFPNDTDGQQRRFKLLCEPPTMLRHCVRLEANEDDFARLLQSVQSFLHQASKLANAEIEQMKMTSNLKPTHHEP